MRTMFVPVPVYYSRVMDQTRVCPICRAHLDVFTGMFMDAQNHPSPPEGALAMCSECGAVLTYAHATEGGFRVATTEEYEKLDPRLQLIIHAYHEVRGFNKGRKS